MATCTHLDHVQVTELPPSRRRAARTAWPPATPWLHLRICLECGHVGCCDDSPEPPRERARARERPPDHPLARAGRGLVLVLRGRGRRCGSRQVQGETRIPPSPLLGWAAGPARRQRRRRRRRRPAAAARAPRSSRAAARSSSWYTRSRSRTVSGLSSLRPWPRARIRSTTTSSGTSIRTAALSSRPVVGGERLGLRDAAREAVEQHRRVPRRAIASSTMPTIRSSGTRSPRSMYSAARCPRSVPSARAARSSSPLRERREPRSSCRRAAWVPFPTRRPEQRDGRLHPGIMPARAGSISRGWSRCPCCWPRWTRRRRCPSRPSR